MRQPRNKNMMGHAHRESTGLATGMKERGFDKVVAALDLGTNNCRMLAGVAARDGCRVVDSFSRVVRLGEGLQATGRLNEAAMDRALDALRACAARMARRPVRAVRAVATEACRQASNGAAFIERVRSETGIAFEIIGPREEALLALESCGPLLKPSARRALLFDIGGGSTELASVRLDGPGRVPALIGYASLPVGVVTLASGSGRRVSRTRGSRSWSTRCGRRSRPSSGCTASGGRSWTGASS